MYANQRSAPWSLTPVQALVEKCCDPSLNGPAYQRNLELCSYINDKKANTPREAAVETVKLVNHRNPHVSVLALHLLDTLVKNGGYPFQLQVGTKEFLNELVRKFPERPPVFPGVAMTKTLELIHEWKNTICVNSKWKEDLVHIRDMHRLLSYKGYRFGDFNRSSALAASGTENLKSPQELEEEDRQAKSAKLQELIRRGTPKDLLAANELMKALSGFEPEKAPDYRSQTQRELDKVQEKAILLNDLLNNATEGERIGIEGDAYSQVAHFCRQARPKIQKWIGEVSEEEPDSMDRLLMINDLINGVIERFEACQKGDWSKGRVDISINSSQQPSSSQSQQPELISFDAFADNNDEPAAISLSPANPLNHTQQPQAEAPPTFAGGLPLDLFSSTPSSFSSAFIPSTQTQQAPKQPIDLSSLYAQPRPQQYNPYQQQPQQQAYRLQQPQYAPSPSSSSPVFSESPSQASNQFSGLTLGGTGSAWAGSQAQQDWMGSSAPVLQPSTSPAPPSGSGAMNGGGATQGGKGKAKDPFEDLLL